MNYFFITIGQVTKKLAYKAGTVADGYLAYYGSQANRTELNRINKGEYSLKTVGEDDFKAEKRYCWMVS